MSDGKIYITISDARTGEVLKDTKITVPKSENAQEAKTNNINLFIKHQLFNLIESEAKQMINYSLGNIGNFTGDYNAQAEVNAALSATNSLKSIAIGAMAGATFGIPGMIIGGATVAASQLINFGLQMHSQKIEVRKQNYNIQQLRQLSGLDGLTNGSRI